MIDFGVLHEVLWRNQGQVLTPELIIGILQGAQFEPPRYIDLQQFEPEVSGSYTFHIERIADIVSEIHPLHEQHWQETEKHRHGLGLNYNYDVYALNDRRGKFLQFTIRKGGELVGYSGMNLYPSTHTQTLVADEDSLFLRKDCRGGRTIFRFIAYIDKCLTQIGVKEVRLSAKILNATDKLLVKCGFTPVATQLVKFLGVNDENQTSL